MQGSYELPVFLEARVEARRLRVSILVALGLHLLPLLGWAASPLRALQAAEALRDEILIQLEPPAPPVPPAGSDGAAALAESERIRAAAPLEPTPPLVPPEEPEREAVADSEPTPPVAPAGDSTPSTVPPADGSHGPVLTQGISGAGDGLFAGNGTGTLHAEICFIPVTTGSLREIRDCTPIYEQYLDRINIPARPFSEGFPGFPDRMEFFAVNIQGTFRVSGAGRYRFRLLSDDGAQLFIDGRLVVDNDGMHEPISRRGEAELSAGQHQIRVWYFQGIRYELALQLFVTPPGAAERILSSEM